LNLRSVKAKKKEELCVVSGLPLKDHPENFLGHYLST
jgi:hypothetical protein